MTNEEAKEELNVIYERLSHPEDCERGVYSFSDGYYLEALDMAIKALEQQSNRCDSCTHSEEQDGSNCYECVKGMADNFEPQPMKMRDATEEERKSVKDYVESISKPTGFNFYKAQPKTSYISIDVNKFAKEVAEKALDEITYEGKTIKEWAEILVKQQPSEDCVSKEAVVQMMIDMDYIKIEAQEKMLRTKLSELPSVTPQPDKDSVSMGVFEQVKWERDIAIEQLKELGYSLGEKIRTDEDCVSRKGEGEKISKQIKELTGIKHYVGTGLEVKLMAEKINELVNQVNELTEAVNVLKGDNMKEQMSGGGEE